MIEFLVKLFNEKKKIEISPKALPSFHNRKKRKISLFRHFLSRSFTMPDCHFPEQFVFDGRFLHQPKQIFEMVWYNTYVRTMIRTSPRSTLQKRPISGDDLNRRQPATNL